MLFFCALCRISLAQEGRSESPRAASARRFDSSSATEWMDGCTSFTLCSSYAYRRCIAQEIWCTAGGEGSMWAGCTCWKKHDNSRSLISQAHKWSWQPETRVRVFGNTHLHPRNPSECMKTHRRESGFRSDPTSKFLAYEHIGHC